MSVVRSITAALALAVAAGSAVADTVQMRYVGSPYVRGVSVTVLSQSPMAQNTAAGVLQHEFAAPASGLGLGLAGRTLQTWCIELQNISSVFNTYQIVDIAAAPVASSNNPNGTGPYGSARANRVHAVMGAALAAGWIDSYLQVVQNASASVLSDRAAAIQLLVWESLFEPGSNAVPVGWDLASGNFRSTTNAAMAANAATLIAGAEQLLASHFRFQGLYAAAGTAGQDQLVVVPLPPAVFGSAGILALFGIVRVSRKKRSAL